jgi:hypothetical protein
MIGLILGFVVLLIVVYILTIIFSSSATLANYQDATTATPIAATSLNDPTSTNYTYSIWLYINDWTVNYGRPKTVFTREGSCPSMKLGAIDNTLTTYVKLTDGSMAICEIPNIPLQTWCNVLISVSSKSIDGYLNGKLVKTSVFSVPPTPPLSTAGINLTPSGGFSGYTARLKYWANSVGPQEAWNNYMVGPGGNLFSNFLNQYKLQFNFIKGTTTQLSVTI